MSETYCSNCGAVLTGPYCAQCGQRQGGDRPSIPSLLHDASIDLAHPDSRFWRTLWLLMTQPGEVPKRYFSGKRASFLPPIRLYLTCSLLFFMVLSFDQSDTGIPLEDADVQSDIVEAAALATETPPNAANPATATVSGGDLRGIHDGAGVVDGADAMRGMHSGIGADPSTVPGVDPSETVGPQSGERLEADAGSPSDVETDDVLTIDFSGNEGGETDDSCNIDYQGLWPEYMQPRLVRTCETAKVDGGRSLVREFTSHLPKAMFLLMPVFALVMKLWYWSPKRYFVEHLLFQVLNHSAFFIALLITSFFALFAPAFETYLASGFLAYFFFYCYRSLRVYYGQSPKLTLVKFASLGLVYLVMLLISFVMVGVATVI